MVSFQWFEFCFRTTCGNSKYTAIALSQGVSHITHHYPGLSKCLEIYSGILILNNTNFRLAWMVPCPIVAVKIRC